MNNTQKVKLFEIFDEAILNDSEIHKEGPFLFNVYKSDKSTKIVIQCVKNNNLVMFYAIDYLKQEYLPECYGINGDDTKFALNCEIEGYPPKIFYTKDNELTVEFNNLYNSKK